MSKPLMTAMRVATPDAAALSRFAAYLSGTEGRRVPIAEAFALVLSTARDFLPDLDRALREETQAQISADNDTPEGATR